MIRHSHLPRLVGAVLCMLMFVLVACSGTGQSATPTAQATTAAELEATQETTTEATAADATVEATAEETIAVAATCTKLNLNDLTEEDLLATIPNFSNRMVREFFEYRPYVSIQQFRREIGKYVDEATVADYEQYVYVPIDVNNADAETLTQIPGVDETIANTLISGRPYADNQAFLDALNADQAASAACYLATESS